MINRRGASVVGFLYVLLFALLIVLFFVSLPRLAFWYGKYVNGQVPPEIKEIKQALPEETYCDDIYKNEKFANATSGLQNLVLTDEQKDTEALNGLLPDALGEEVLPLLLCFNEEQKNTTINAKLIQLAAERLNIVKRSQLALLIEEWMKQRLLTATPRLFELTLIVGVVGKENPLVERQTGINELMTLNKELAEKLLYALYWDGEKTGFIRETFLKDLGLALEGSGDKELLLAIVNHPLLGNFMVNMVSKQTQIYDSEFLLQLLRSSVSKNIFLATEIIRELAGRSIFDKYQLEYVSALLDNEARLSSDVKKVFILGALGQITSGEIEILSRLEAGYMYRPLYAACVKQPISDVNLAALDALATHSNQSTVVLSILDFIKTRYWSERGKIVRLLGILGLLNIANEDEVKEMINGLAPLLPKGSFFDELVSTQNNLVIRQAVSILGMGTNDERLLRLLNNDDIAIKAEVIKALRNRRDLAVIQAIRRLWSREENAEIKQAIAEYHADLIKEN
ncbi:MAG: HEAT repeat domain-containing protein [Deltaproteobacteria bacterium]|nr:HEAT repeat domain-containing protein [Deltaproteobacteria bacterium]